MVCTGANKDTFSSRATSLRRRHRGRLLLESIPNRGHSRTHDCLDFEVNGSRTSAEIYKTTANSARMLDNAYPLII